MIVLTAAALLLSSAAAVVAALELWLCGYSLWTDRMDVAVVRSVLLVLATLVVWLQSSPALAQASLLLALAPLSLLDSAHGHTSAARGVPLVLAALATAVVGCAVVASHLGFTIARSTSLPLLVSSIDRKSLCSSRLCVCGYRWAVTVCCAGVAAGHPRTVVLSPSLLSPSSGRAKTPPLLLPPSLSLCASSSIAATSSAVVIAAPHCALLSPSPRPSLPPPPAVRVLTERGLLVDTRLSFGARMAPNNFQRLYCCSWAG